MIQWMAMSVEVLHGLLKFATEIVGFAVVCASMVSLFKKNS
jgi:hypothetical protein